MSEMSAQPPSEIKLEIGHVLFIDIVGYSKLLINKQSQQLETLKQIVRGTEQFSAAEAEGKLLRLPTGDGGALVFGTNPEAPVLCALEISRELKNHPELRVRMGIHSGPVNAITDLNEQANIAGAGINYAQRVMDCGDAGHILLSKHVAEDLEHYPRWQPHLHDLGQTAVKHGVMVSAVNLYTDEVGNPAVPEKFRAGELPPVPAPKRWTFVRPLLIGGVASLILLAVLGWFLLRQTWTARSSEAAATAVPKSEAGRAGDPALPVKEKSIAVLPFENLSSDKENAYFADGIQDEILTRLSKVADLKVISRTSTQKYKSAPDNLREVGRQLGVAHLLEGSVQKAANAVHVNVQLIKTASDEHVWAESYDRTLENIFGVEGEIAQTVAETLKAKLNGTEQQALTQKPTNNPAAYDAFLRGTGQYFQFTDDSLKAAVEAYEQAVKLDPNFAAAWAALSRTHSLMYFHFDVTPARRASAQGALAEAVRLQPELEETQLARGYFQYWVLKDYPGALELMRHLQARWPSNAEILRIIAFISARVGQWKESVESIDRARELDPRDLYTCVQAVSLHLATREFERVVQLADVGMQVWPENNDLPGLKAAALQARGEMDAAQAVLNGRTPNVVKFDGCVGAMFGQAWLRRDPEIAVRLFQPAATSPTPPSNPAFWLFWGELQRMSGKNAESQAVFARLADELQKGLKSQPDNWELMGALAYTFSRLEKYDLAIETLDKVSSMTAGDARTAGILEEIRARVLTRAGKKDSAIASVQRVLANPSDGTLGPPLTPAVLRLDPDFDPLRGDARFEKLCQQPNK